MQLEKFAKKSELAWTNKCKPKYKKHVFYIDQSRSLLRSILTFIINILNQFLK